MTTEMKQMTKVWLWGFTRNECDLVRKHVCWRAVCDAAMPGDEVSIPAMPGRWYRTQQAASVGLTQYLTEQIAWLQAKLDKIERIDNRMEQPIGKIWGGD